MPKYKIDRFSQNGFYYHPVGESQSLDFGEKSHTSPRLHFYFIFFPSLYKLPPPIRIDGDFIGRVDLY